MCQFDVHKVTDQNGTKHPVDLDPSAPAVGGPLLPRTTEHPKSKSTGGFYHSDGSPCNIHFEIRMGQNTFWGLVLPLDEGCVAEVQ